MNINALDLIEFTFESIGNLTKKSYGGVFKIKSNLNFIEKIHLETEVRSILNHPQIGEAVDNESINMAYMLAFFKLYIVKSPPWFADSNGLRDIYDRNVPNELFDKIIDETKKWSAALTEKADQVKKELSSK